MSEVQLVSCSFQAPQYGHALECAIHWQFTRHFSKGSKNSCPTSNEGGTGLRRPMRHNFEGRAELQQHRSITPTPTPVLRANEKPRSRWQRRECVDLLEHPEIFAAEVLNSFGAAET